MAEVTHIAFEYIKTPVLEWKSSDPGSTYHTMPIRRTSDILHHYILDFSSNIFIDYFGEEWFPYGFIKTATSKLYHGGDITMTGLELYLATQIYGSLRYTPEQVRNSSRTGKLYLPYPPSDLIRYAGFRDINFTFMGKIPLKEKTCRSLFSILPKDLEHTIYSYTSDIDMFDVFPVIEGAYLETSIRNGLRVERRAPFLQLIVKKMCYTRSGKDIRVEQPRCNIYGYAIIIQEEPWDFIKNSDNLDNPYIESVQVFDKEENMVHNNGFLEPPRFDRLNIWRFSNDLPKYDLKCEIMSFPDLPKKVDHAVIHLSRDIPQNHTLTVYSLSFSIYPT